MQHIKEQQKYSEPRLDEEGMHIVGKGAPPSPEDLERMTVEYQNRVKKSPMWEMMVKEYGEKKAEEMLKEFQVQVK